MVFTWHLYLTFILISSILYNYSIISKVGNWHGYNPWTLFIFPKFLNVCICMCLALKLFPIHLLMFYKWDSVTFNHNVLLFKFFFGTCLLYLMITFTSISILLFYFHNKTFYTHYVSFTFQTILIFQITQNWYQNIKRSIVIPYFF